MVKNIIIDNSLSLQILKESYGGSLALRLWKGLRDKCREVWKGLGDKCSAVLEGSRISRLLRVGDYLDVPGDKLLALIRNSRAGDAATKTIAPYRGRLRFILETCSSGESRLIAALAEISGERRTLLSPRNSMSFVLIFLALFFLGRLALLALFPGAYFYLPWTSGLLLSAILLIILLQLESRERPRAAGKTGGLISRSLSAAAWLADKIRLFLKFWLSAVLNRLRGPRPPVEGGY